MIFTPENAQKIMAGTKWVTRRILKDNEYLEWENVEYATPTVYRITNGRAYVKWQVGRTYAVCPGRGKRAIGRIKIIGLSQEELQSIMDEDVIAEGIPPSILGIGGREAAFRRLWDSINKAPGTRWGDDPDVFRIEFEVIE